MPLRNSTEKGATGTGEFQKLIMKQESQDLCSICYTNESSLQLMPCCGLGDSSAHYCLKCLQTICYQNNRGSFGHCPTCRTLIHWSEGSVHLLELSTQQQIGLCYLCCSTQILVERQLCEACLYGSYHSLRYECCSCHQIQRIPHPLWRYQENSFTYGTYQWVCHQEGCQQSTYWRVIPDDIILIPLRDIPESWGVKRQSQAAWKQFRCNESDESAEADHEKKTNKNSSKSISQVTRCIVM
jgi:hypothetical protein